MATGCKYKTAECSQGTVQTTDQLTLCQSSGDKRVGFYRVTKIEHFCYPVARQPELQVFQAFGNL